MSLHGKVKDWLFRPRQDEAQPIELSQRRIFILPTRAGLLFAVVLLTMLTGAINYNLSLGHALVFLLAGVALVAMVHTFANLFRLQLRATGAAPVFAGEVAFFPVIVDNPQPRPRRALRLTFAANDARLAHVGGKVQEKLLLPFKTTQRGRLRPGRINLWSDYPLGLFRAWSTPHPALSSLVYPRPIASPLPSAAGLRATGEARGDSGQEDFTGLRERLANDSPRHIAWKAVARDFEQRPLLVKQFAGGAGEELCLDWSLTRAEGSVETRLSLLAGWIVAAERAQSRYALRLPGSFVAAGHGAAHYHACLERLALYEEG